MAKRKRPNAAHFPRRVLERNLKEAARGEKKIVHVIKKGKNSSVSRLDEYAMRKVVTRTVKPLKNRKLKIDILNPLGAVAGSPLGPFTRDQIYEE